MGKNVVRRVVVLAAACAMLSACGIGSWFESAPEKGLPGKRISILPQSKALEADAGAQGEIVLPPPEAQTEWPQAGGYPTHDLQNVVLAAKPRQVWTVDLSTGGNDRLPFIGAPIVVGGKVFVVDAQSEAAAYDLTTGEKLWRSDLIPEEAGDGSFGGGIAFDDGKLFITNAFSELLAVDPATGKILWRENMPAPVRGAPTVHNGRVIVITIDNETLALSAEDGHRLWHHSGISEVAAIVGAPSAAIEGNTVLVPYTSGELFALRIENGTVEWSDVLATIKRTDQISELSDIRGLPVIDHGRVFAASNSDVMAAIDLRTGRRLWDKPVGSLQTPWVAGDFVFLVTTTPDVVCFEARTGKVRWVRPLQLWEDEEDKSGRITWTGPVLAADRLIVVSSLGKAVAISPYTGAVLGEEELDGGVTIPPVISNGTLLYTTIDGQLLAYR